MTEFNNIQGGANYDPFGSNISQSSNFEGSFEEDNWANATEESQDWATPQDSYDINDQGEEGIDEIEEESFQEEPEIPDDEADIQETGNIPPIDMNEKSLAEYDSVFSGEEQLEQMFVGIKDKFSTELKTVPVDSIILPRAKKEMRAKTIMGLTGLVSTLSGVVTPIHLMTLEDSDDEYIILDGTRRLYSAIKSGATEINAIVWDFKDKALGASLANILGLVLNRSQQLKNSELWSMLKVLEVVNRCTPGKIEYLLQMQSGDAMKLKDIMLAEGDEEIQELKEKFINDELTIEGAYKKLTSLRKKENRLERDEDRELDLRNIDQGTDEGALYSDNAGSDAAKPRLSNDEVLDLLEMGFEDVSEQTLDDLKAKGEALRADNPDAPHVQEVGKRHPVDPAIKKATLERDGYKCRCCGIGGALYLSILVFHHLVPVFAGGPDTVDNGLTLCANCHLMLHNYVDGHLKGDLGEYDEDTQKAFKEILKYGNVAINAAKKMGLKRADVHKLDAESRKHIMPNANVKVNYEGYSEHTARQEGNDED